MREVKLLNLSNNKSQVKHKETTKNNDEFNDNSTKNVEIKKETLEVRPKSKVRKENYIHIPGWAVCELGLKGNELLIYAIIHGFSQEENQTFRGSIRYLVDWTGSSKMTVIRALRSLETKKLIRKIERFENGVKFCEYCVTRYENLQKEPDNEMIPVVSKWYRGGIKMIPNILENNLGTNSINRISKVSKKESQLEQDKISPKKEKNNSNSISQKQTKAKKTKPKTISFDAIIDAYTENENLRVELKEHLKTRKQKKAALTNRALELSLKKLDKLADSDEEKIQIVQNSIINGWVGFFELNEKNKNKLNNHSSYNLDEYVKAMDTFSSEPKKPPERLGLWL